MSVFWGMHHTGANWAAAADARDARRSARELQSRLEAVSDRCDKAMLVCEALWTILRDKLGVSEQELVDRVNDIDLSDGRLDGKVRKVALECAQCGRNVAPRFPRCPYCGSSDQHDPFSG